MNAATTLQPDEIDAIRAHIDAGDYARAIALVGEVLRVQRNNLIAVRLGAEARQLLERKHVRTIGSVASVLHVADPAILARCDTMARMVAKNVDGSKSLEEIASASELPRVVTLRILCDLLAVGALGVR